MDGTLETHGGRFFADDQQFLEHRPDAVASDPEPVAGGDRADVAARVPHGLGDLTGHHVLGGPDHRLLFLLHAALSAAALAAAGPVLGIIDIRFVPFAQLALCLAGAAAAGLVAGRLAAPDLAALGLVALAILHGDVNSRVVRSWIDWNYTGLEAKENWPAFQRMTAAIAGGVGDPRVAVEYGAEHEKAGSIRMYETLPFFSGRSTLEGVYNQASVMTHPVYYLASELGATSPNPFRRREYSRFDTDAALAHLRLFNVSEVVTVSAQLATALASRPGIERIARMPPYSVFRLPAERAGYVQPLAFAPVRSPLRDWREKSYRWFTRKPFGGPHLVFTDDAAITAVEPDEWLAPPASPLPGGVEAHATVAEETITITTSRVGHPLLVKVSYHPRWIADGADGPYLASPGLMIVVPRRTTVTLHYARSAADRIGLALTLMAVIGAAAHLVRRRARRRVPPPPVVLPADSCDAAPAPRRWGAIVPAAVIVLPLFVAFGCVYFAMAFMLLGAIFLGVGAQASTMREIQMLSLPITLFQLIMFGLSMAAAGNPGTSVAHFAQIFPFSSPFAMAARGATDPAIWPHLLALGWQLLWVAITIALGAHFFRYGVLKSGVGPFAAMGRWLSRSRAADTNSH